MGNPTKQERLEKYIGLEAEIEYLRERVAQKKAKAQYSPRTMGEYHGQQVTGDRQERGIIAYMMDDASAANELRAIVAEKAAIDAAIAALPDPWERLVLRYRYTDRERGATQLPSFMDLGEKLYGERNEKTKSAARRHHNSALAHLALPETEKSHP